MRTEIVGCPVDNMTMDEAIEHVARFIAQGGPHQGMAINADKAVMANRDPEIMAILRRADLVYADGMPILWAARLLGTPLKARVTGIDFFLKLCEQSVNRRWRIYLLGARQNALSRAMNALQARYPGIRIVGVHDGYWSEADEASVVRGIAETEADLLFVALPSPKKEQFLDRYQAEMGVAYAMGVGGSFDVVAGTVKRAPVWMQRLGLEWFYRFLQEPRRMFYRYFVQDMAFFGLLFQAWRRRRQKVVSS